MNKAVILLTAFVLTAVPMAGAVPDLGIVTDDPSLEKDYIVSFHRLPERLTEPGAEYRGAEVTDVDQRLHFVVVHTDNWVHFEASARSDDRVRYLEEDHNEWHLALTPNDEHYNDPGHYGTAITNTEAAWDTTTGSTSVILNLLDSGITEGHEDFENSRVTDGWDYVNNDGTPEDHNGCSYHGSHTAGTAAATINNQVGIAGMSQSTIVMHKIFDSGFMGCGAASTSDIADALMDAADKGAHVSSNSWGGGGTSSTLNEAIDYAHKKGTVIVAAAGNDGSCTDCVGEPWKSRPDKTIIVSCSDDTDSFCSFSSQGPEVDIIAPGDDILSVDGGTTTGYQTMSGTSMSTPHVAGAVALYVDANGDASFSTIEGTLGSTADDLGLSANRQGDGRLNTGAFIGGNAGPTADFTSSCTELNCTFDGSGSSDSDGTISSYDWDFGDGTTGTGELVDHSYSSSGDYTVTLTVTDDEGATDSTSKTVSVTDGSATTLLDEDFEDASADGWTKSSDTNDLWRVASDCVTPAGGSYDLAFSRASPDCDYDVGTAHGWANTPTMDAGGYSTVTLAFDHFWETESYNGEYDVMEVQVSSDGGSTWTAIAHWDSSNSNPANWTSLSYDISSYASSTLEVRFLFDSKDSVSNDYLGWYVDNVVVTAS